MNNWTLTVLKTAKGYPIKVYTNEKGTEAVVFFLFGRYTQYGCYNSTEYAHVLDFVTDMLLGSTNNVVKFSNYVNSLEDTSLIDIETLKAI